MSVQLDAIDDNPPALMLFKPIDATNKRGLA